MLNTKDLNNKNIKKLILYITEIDKQTFLKSDLINNIQINKIEFIINNKEPTYKELFLKATEFNNEFVCILNSDIELIIKNESILKELNKSSCFFLTRHEVDNTRPLIDQMR